MVDGILAFLSIINHNSEIRNQKSSIYLIKNQMDL